MDMIGYRWIDDGSMMDRGMFLAQQVGELKYIISNLRSYLIHTLLYLASYTSGILALDPEQSSSQQ